MSLDTPWSDSVPVSINKHNKLLYIIAYVNNTELKSVIKFPNPTSGGTVILLIGSVLPSPENRSSNEFFSLLSLNKDYTISQDYIYLLNLFSKTYVKFRNSAALPM